MAEKVKVLAWPRVDEDDGRTVLRLGANWNDRQVWAETKFLVDESASDEVAISYIRAKVVNAVALLRYHGRGGHRG